MNFDIYYTRHALQRMFERSISDKDVQKVIEQGEIVTEYPDDKPYPSFLSMMIIDEKPLHVVFSIDDTVEKNRYIVITLYEPAQEEWDPDFKKRRD